LAEKEGIKELIYAQQSAFMVAELGSSKFVLPIETMFSQ